MGCMVKRYVEVLRERLHVFAGENKIMVPSMLTQLSEPLLESTDRKPGLGNMCLNNQTLTPFQGGQTGGSGDNSCQMLF